MMGVRLVASGALRLGMIVGPSIFRRLTSHGAIASAGLSELSQRCMQTGLGHALMA